MTLYCCEDTRIFDRHAGLPTDTLTQSRDFPGTPGYICSGGLQPDGSLLSDGSAGWLLYGPYAKAEAGCYEISLSYEVLSCVSEQPAVFDAAAAAGTQILAAGVLDPRSNTVTLQVDVPEDALLEFRVHTDAGTFVQLRHIDFVRLAG